jgi:hypothetical protein
MEILGRRSGRRLGAAALAGLIIAALLVTGLLVGRPWLARQPRVSPLPSAPSGPVDVQAERFARIARVRLLPLYAAGATGEGESPGRLRPIELLGNPAAERYPRSAQTNARNPWDLAAFDGRLYVGLGDYDNQGASANAGPVPVYAYDPLSGVFERQTTLDEEQIDRFYVFGPELLVPGTDPRQSWDLGNLYRRSLEGQWYKLRTLPRTIHTLALAQHDGRLFAGVSVTEAVPPGVGKQRYGSAVAVSDDGGASWRLDLLGGWRICDFLELRGALYAADIFPGPAVQCWIDQEGRAGYHSPLYEYQPDGSFRRRTDLSAQAMFPDTRLAGRRAGTIERAVPWGEAAAYIGAFAYREGELPTRGLYIAEDLTPGHVRTRRIALPPGATAWDLLVGGGRLHVLLAAQRSDESWRNEVWSSADGKHWAVRAAFSAVTFARSFARLGDFYYFGLGSLSHLGASGLAPADQATGTLLRIPAREGPAVSD